MAVKGEVDQKYVVIEEVNDSPRISRGVSLTSTRTRAVVNRATRLRSNWSQMARFLNITGVDADASEGGEEGDHMDQYLFGDSYFASPGVDVDETRSVGHPCTRVEPQKYRRILVVRILCGWFGSVCAGAVSYTHLTLPTKLEV